MLIITKLIATLIFKLINQAKSIIFVSFCIFQLLLSLPVKVNKGVEEVWDASTNVKEVDNSIVKVEVETVGHDQQPASGLQLRHCHEHQQQGVEVL